MLKFGISYQTTIFFVNLINIFFLCSAFCVDKEKILKKIENLSVEEKEDLTNFFRIHFHSSSFGYTIFGEKPMSLDAIDISGRPPFEEVERLGSRWGVWSYRKKEAWDVWRTHFQDIPLKNFSFIFYPVLNYPETIHFSVINHKFFLEVVKNNTADFQLVLNRPIDPHEILREYSRGEGELFELIKNHDALLGILLGYGRENAWKYMREEELSPNVDPYSLNPKDLSIVWLPLFKVVKGSKETEQINLSFEKYRGKINEIYQKDNFLELVLLRLFCSEVDVDLRLASGGEKQL